MSVCRATSEVVLRPVQRGLRGGDRHLRLQNVQLGDVARRLALLGVAQCPLVRRQRFLGDGQKRLLPQQIEVGGSDLCGQGQPGGVELRLRGPELLLRLRDREARPCAQRQRDGQRVLQGAERLLGWGRLIDAGVRPGDRCC